MPEDQSTPCPVAAIILAAGKSTRMRSRLPKPLHPLCGLPMTAHVIRACQQAGVERVVVVVGHEAETVRAGLGETV
ncbi:MAG: NTP transferase domain-containing protein, partial [Chthonomonadaceae bacterium]|nr:NTP transferase domain-containing protein [Chthonomonadaceae bacterium]